jgi:hypothetical protein
MLGECGRRRVRERVLDRPERRQEVGWLRLVGWLAAGIGQGTLSVR